MALHAGARLGDYEVLSSLGAGGMGEVYRARDTGLGREVALKLLPDEVATDPERLARFKREARVLASLNHANIATLYGFESAGDTHFLVMELVSGETLADRIARGPIPVAEAIALFIEIAEGLEAAHDKGIVHRDLKPANIKISDEGSVKILDFGLAKAQVDDSESGNAALSHSPTLTLAATQRGQILGTAAYMAPEQAKGKSVDKRADVWAFGACLFETLTGKRMFAGDDASELLASVLLTEPAWDALPAETPRHVRALLRRCLVKNPRDRLHDIADARIELSRGLDDAEPAGGVPLEAPAPHRRRAWIGLVGSAAVGALGVAVGWWAAPRAEGPAAAAVRRFQIDAGTNLIMPVDGRSGPVLSPDGKRIAYVHQEKLWVRELAGLEPRMLPGTEMAERPFWSPQGDWVGYFTGARINAAVLWKVPVREGPATFLGRLPGSTDYGATWSHDGAIVVASTNVQEFSKSQLFAMDAESGRFSQWSDESSSEIVAGTLFPHWLPDGETLLAVEVAADDRWSIVARRHGARSELVHHPRERLAHPVFSSAGYVVYERRLATQTWEESEGIWAFRFDPSDLGRDGEPFRVSAEGFRPSAGPDGTLLYHAIEGESQKQLAWVDRAGTLLETLGEPHEEIEVPKISPDGRRIAYQALDDENWDIWLLDLEDGSRTRLTVDPAYEESPAWSPDGSRIAFGSERSGSGDIYVQAATGRGSVQALVTTPEPQYYPEWERDGGGVLFHAFDADAGWSIWRQSMEGQPTVLHREAGGASSHPQLSPDGLFLAYVAVARGDRSTKVYLAPATDPEERWQVSEDIGTGLRWGRRGDTIFYADQRTNTLMAATVRTQPEVTIGRSEALFSGADLPAALFTSSNRPQFDVTADGQRFLVVRNLRQKRTVATFIENWHLESGEPP